METLIEERSEIIELNGVKIRLSASAYRYGSQEDEYTTTYEAHTNAYLESTGIVLKEQNRITSALNTVVARDAKQTLDRQATYIIHCLSSEHALKDRQAQLETELEAIKRLQR